MRRDGAQPGTPEYVAKMDQVKAGYQELGQIYGSTFHGLVANGVPRWAAAWVVGVWIAAANTINADRPVDD